MTIAWVFAGMSKVFGSIWLTRVPKICFTVMPELLTVMEYNAIRNASTVTVIINRIFFDLPLLTFSLSMSLSILPNSIVLRLN